MLPDHPGCHFVPRSAELLLPRGVILQFVSISVHSEVVLMFISEYKLIFSVMNEMLNKLTNQYFLLQGYSGFWNILLHCGVLCFGDSCFVGG